MGDNVIVLNYTKINSQYTNHFVFNALLDRLPLKEQQRILSYYQHEDKVRSLLGRLLLLEGCRQLNIEVDLNRLLYDDYNRPHFAMDLDFNISHAGKYVLCGIATTSKIGVDIEKNRSMDLDDYKSLFSEKEWNEINASNCSIKEFYRRWVVKEAILKQMGCGFSLSIDLIKNLKLCKKKVHFLPIDSDYTSVVVSSEDILKVVVNHNSLV